MHNTPASSDSASILVVLPNNLGDVIMATPVLEGLHHKYRGAHIVFLCETGFEAGIENNPYCGKILSMPRAAIRTLLVSDWQSGKRMLSEFVRKCSPQPWDTIINLSQQTYVSSMMPLMTGVAILGQHFLAEGNHAITDPWSQYLYAIPFSRGSNSLHAVDVYRRIAGVKSHRGGYSVVLTDQEKSAARGRLRECGIADGAPVIAFQVGAAFPSKCWPAAYFRRLGELLAQKGYRIIFTGAKSEEKYASGIAMGIGSAAVSFAGKTSFRESIALVSQCVGCVTGDTAQMHAAASQDAPVYAIFGPTSPVETGPYGTNHFVFSGKCGSMPCFKTDCGSMECMHSILPEDVYNCITAQSCSSSCSCNVYRTSLSPNGDYSLVPIRAAMHRYYNEAAVCIVRNIFEDRWNCIPSRADYAHAVAELGKWIEILSDMVNALMKFDNTKDKTYLTMFEVLKKSMEGMNSVGAFCTALLNIKLNSIPMLSPLDAVRQSMQVCWQMHKQAGKAVA